MAVAIAEQVDTSAASANPFAADANQLQQLPMWAVTEAYDVSGQSMFGPQYIPAHSPWEAFQAKSRLRTLAEAAGQCIVTLVQYASLEAYDQWAPSMGSRSYVAR